MSALTIRVISAIVFLIIMLFGIYLHPISLFILFGIMNFIGIWEYEKLVDIYEFNKHKHLNIEKIVMATIGTVIYFIIGIVALNMVNIKYLVLILPILFSIFVKELFNSQSPSPFVRLTLNITAIIYISIPFGLINFIANLNGVFSPNIILGILLLIWINDSVAYLVGSKIGKTPLFKRVSPKKTWEGTIGGAVGCLLAPFALAYFFTDFDYSTWLALSIIVMFTATIGDLVESLLKRSVLVKDSGNLMPGHGGVLDRFDAIIFSIPFVFTYLYLIK